MGKFAGIGTQERHDNLWVSRAKNLETLGMQDVTLNAGDVLYMPPGFWHEGRTAESHSLHYSLTFMPITSWHLLVAYLRRRVFTTSAMRKDLRYSVENGQRLELIEAAISEFRSSMDQISAAELQELFSEISSARSPLASCLVQP